MKLAFRIKKVEEAEAGDSPFTLDRPRLMVLELEKVAQGTRFLVRRIRPCPVCNGEGIIQNAMWEMFWTKYPPGTSTIEQEKQFWAEQGYYDGPPNEEEPCYECQGRGEVEDWVSLSEALSEIAGGE